MEVTKIINKTENTVNKQTDEPIKPKNKPWQFQPGQSGNPAGKPKGTKHFNTLFQDLLKEQIILKDGTKMTMLKAMGLAMARKAMRGDVSAFSAVADRLDGKPSQDIELEVTTPPAPIYGGKSIRRAKKV